MLRKTLLKKTAQITAVLLLFSALTPILAFAAVHFSSYSYDKVNGKVTATVYSDVYHSGKNMNLRIFKPDGLSLVDSVYKAVYDRVDSVTGVTYFTFNVSVTPAVYDSVYLKAYYELADTGSLLQVNNSNTSNPNPGGGCCGGGGGYPPATGDVLDVPASGEVNADGLKAALAKNTHIQMKLAGDFALLPASALVDAKSKPEAMITLGSANGSYMLPLSALDLEALAASLDIKVSDLKIKVSITKLTGDQETAILEAIKALGGTSASAAVDFKVEAVGKDGKTIAVNLDNAYISRTIPVNKTIDTKKTTGLLFNETTKKLSFVPATFETKDDKTVATLKRQGNSIYTVAEFDKSFNDITTHWSKNDVQLLANKLVVDGVTDTTFQPERNITRAEFAALVVRSLGLDGTTGTANPFNDVNSSAWYASVVATAAQAKIIDGYEDGTFRPNAQITREELSAMVIRALKYAGVNTDITAAQQSELLGKFTDSNRIVWAQQEIAAAIHAGIIDGMTDTTIGSNQQATRAQSATMLKRFLTKAVFIN
ncbi:S-layer homology domain-containing protein [Paenibacillus eucommiae]|uniref:SLH domain-containing protein n=1 Tax=Paenibacillus eucommiae TaxID=1355755 RepID=A0ABS4IUG7_9BACL|nr:S-layer homology domain-containing protein [Paenibacillus eucommiae]MBP1991153.1 hypothetical protein [Paenibacillus eucommiae]